MSYFAEARFLRLVVVIVTLAFSILLLHQGGNRRSVLGELYQVPETEVPGTGNTGTRYRKHRYQVPGTEPDGEFRSK